MGPEKDVSAKLVLEDGSIYRGSSFGFLHSTAGEVVFSTGMVGYPQSLTDPSYAGQVLAFTYPLIGNYGVGDKARDKHGLLEHFESERIQVSGPIVSESCAGYSHFSAKKSLQEWLVSEKITAISGIDTRALTKRLREKGVMLGKIVVGDEETEFYDPNKENLVERVSCKRAKEFGSGKYRVIAVDCGIKNSILRLLLKRDVSVKVVPWDYDFCNEDYDGLFLSNGPGDPAACKETIGNIGKAIEARKPIFGICLGNQLLAIAAGAKTYKLKYGHRSQNQPCISENRGYITSQNHGFAVDKRTLPKGYRELFVNANDKTNEGIIHERLPFFSVQFHPEGSSGPRDTEYLFDEFITRMGDKRWR